jgi:hypothetical protein
MRNNHFSTRLTIAHRPANAARTRCIHFSFAVFPKTPDDSSKEFGFMDRVWVAGLRDGKLGRTYGSRVAVIGQTHDVSYEYQGPREAHNTTPKWLNTPPPNPNFRGGTPSMDAEV